MFRFHPMFWLIVALVWMFASHRRRWIRRRAMSFAHYGPTAWGPTGWGPSEWAPFRGPRGDARTQDGRASSRHPQHRSRSHNPIARWSNRSRAGSRSSRRDSNSPSD